MREIQHPHHRWLHANNGVEQTKWKAFSKLRTICYFIYYLVFYLYLVGYFFFTSNETRKTSTQLPPHTMLVSVCVLRSRCADKIIPSVGWFGGCFEFGALLSNLFGAVVFGIRCNSMLFLRIRSGSGIPNSAQRVTTFSIIIHITTIPMTSLGSLFRNRKQSIYLFLEKVRVRVLQHTGTRECFNKNKCRYFLQQNWWLQAEAAPEDSVASPTLRRRGDLVPHVKFHASLPCSSCPSDFRRSRKDWLAHAELPVQKKLQKKPHKLQNKQDAKMSRRKKKRAEKNGLQLDMQELEDDLAVIEKRTQHETGDRQAAHCIFHFKAFLYKNQKARSFGGAPWCIGLEYLWNQRLCEVEARGAGENDEQDRNQLRPVHKGKQVLCL